MATALTEVEQFLEDTYGHKKVKMKQSDVDKVKQQILSQGLTDKWKGEGFGSADANALDMAKSLVASGVTDIKQIGQGTYYVPQVVQERLVDGNGQPVQKMGDQYVVPQYAASGDGGPTELVGYTNVPAEQVIKQLGYEKQYDNGQEYGSGTAFQALTPEEQSKLKTDANGQMSFLVEGGQGIINKDTGERILSNYNERTQDNAFGGTYSGKGNTAYRVSFKDGTPVFYTTAASSNDLANILQGNPILNVAANMAATYFGGPLGTMALQAAQGKDTKDIVKAGALSWAGGKIGNYLGNSESLVNALGQTGAKIAANTAKSFVTSEGKIDPVAALLSSGADAAVGAIIGNIPNFSNLDKGTQTAVTKAISTTLRTGKLDPASLAQAAFKAGTSAMANATNTPTEAQFNAANTDFLKTLEPYLTGNAADKQDHLIKVLTDVGMTPEEVANTDWAALYNTNVDTTQFPNQSLNVDQAQFDSYTNNLQGIIDNKGGYTSQWQTVGSDRIMIQDDGTAIATNENGDPYSLSKNEVDKMVSQGILNTADSGYVKATGGTGNTPGGTKLTTTATTTKPTTTKPTTTTPTDPFAAITAAGVIPGVGDVANIKPNRGLFGALPGEKTIKKLKEDNLSEEDESLKQDKESILDLSEDYFNGGSVTSVDDLLQLLRS